MQLSCFLDFMSHTLLSKRHTATRATQSHKMAAFLDTIEDGFLRGKQIERKMVKALGLSAEVVDISSAASMNIFHTFIGTAAARLKANVKSGLIDNLESYPYLVPRDHSLEDVWVAFLFKWLRVKTSREEVVVFNGIYSSFSIILLSQQENVVIIPEYIHQTHKACFASVGKKVVEIPMTKEKLLDLEILEKQLRRYHGSIACLYLYHARPTHLRKDYFQSIAKLLKKYGVMAVIDLDVAYTSYAEDACPWLPMTISELRERSIFLFNLTKEVGVPGLRIGFGIASQAMASHIRRFQQMTFQMIPPLNRAIARWILQVGNLDRVKKEFQARMEALTTSLEALGFVKRSPCMGVSYFLHVPESFAASKKVLPDHLFSYFVLTRAKVLLRPGSLHGHRLNHYVRIVLSRQKKDMALAIKRMAKAGVHASMALPEGIEEEYLQFIRSVM